MVRSIIRRVVVVLAVILVLIFGRGLFYYSGFYQAPTIEAPSFNKIVAPLAPSTEYSDSYQMAEGSILFDIAHSNNFDTEELNVLILRLVSRGLTVDFFSSEDDLEKKLLSEPEAAEDIEQIEEGGEESELPPNAFLVVCPWEEFTRDDIKHVSEFVENGGKLLLIGDPTRRSQINSLSYHFGLIFEPDYLYNMKENDANYRNIFISNFKENTITKKLQTIAMYTAGSISSDNYGIAFCDDNTFSSLVETSSNLSPIAKRSNVLGIYDLTFFTEPYIGVLDNNQLISNIADWLAYRTSD